MNGPQTMAWHRSQSALAAAVCALGLCAMNEAQAEESHSAFFTHAASCTAAHKAEVEALRKTWAPGKTALREAILRQTVTGFTFVAVSYKLGLRNPQADDLLKAAEEDHKALSAAEHQARLAACTAEGNKLFQHLSSAERWFIENRSNARVDKLLAPKDS